MHVYPNSFVQNGDECEGLEHVLQGNTKEETISFELSFTEGVDVKRVRHERIAKEQCDRIGLLWHY